MGAPDVLAQLAALGVHLHLDGDALIAEPRSALTDDARALIRAHKPELLRALQSAQEPVGEPEADGMPSINFAGKDSLERAYALLQGRVIARLESGTADLVVIADEEMQSGAVLVAVGRRNKFVCVLEIDPAKYDGVRLLELVERHTLH